MVSFEIQQRTDTKCNLMIPLRCCIIKGLVDMRGGGVFSSDSNILKCLQGINLTPRCQMVFKTGHRVSLEHLTLVLRLAGEALGSGMM
jgi:hypothetical protein